MGFRQTTAEEVRGALFELLPWGAVWYRELDNRFADFLLAVAEELARLHNKVASLVDEADPRTTSDLLADWEEVYGLPEPCDPSPSSDPDDRRAVLSGKASARGGQSPSYFKGIADEITGEDCTIHEYALTPFVAGSPAGAYLYSVGTWAHWWGVEIPNVDVTHFVAGSPAGTAVASYPSRVSQLACILGRIKPAHTRFFFDFPDDDPNT